MIVPDSSVLIAALASNHKDHERAVNGVGGHSIPLPNSSFTWLSRRARS